MNSSAHSYESVDLDLCLCNRGQMCAALLFRVPFPLRNGNILTKLTGEQFPPAEVT